MNYRNRIVPVFCFLLTTLSFADFRYQENTKITGGTMVGMMKVAGAFSKDAKQAMEPMSSTVLVKGNRMAHINPNTTEIIDLDKETITQIDHRKKQYTVMTFQQMKRQLEEAQKKAQQQTKAQTPKQPGTNAEAPQMNFKVNVRNTGALKNVAGLEAKEAILSMVLEGTDQKTGQQGGLAITNDMWMVPEIPGYSEVRDFNRRLATKMGVIFGDVLRPSMAAMQPGSAEGMAAMVKEMSKLNGVPVMQVMRMGATVNGQPLPAASEVPLPESTGSEMPSGGEVAKKSVSSAIAGKLGGFGGFGRKKKQDQSPDQAQNQSSPDRSQTGQTPATSVLVESTTETTDFSSASIDSSQFNPPAGYTEVPANINRDEH